MNQEKQLKEDSSDSASDDGCIFDDIHSSDLSTSSAIVSHKRRKRTLRSKRRSPCSDVSSSSEKSSEESDHCLRLDPIQMQRIFKRALNIKDEERSGICKNAHENKRQDHYAGGARSELRKNNPTSKKEYAIKKEKQDENCDGKNIQRKRRNEWWNSSRNWSNNQEKIIPRFDRQKSMPTANPALYEKFSVKFSSSKNGIFNKAPGQELKDRRALTSLDQRRLRGNHFVTSTIWENGATRPYYEQKFQYGPPKFQIECQFIVNPFHMKGFSENLRALLKQKH